MNTGAEAVETAIKAARRWGYRVKGIARGSRRDHRRRRAISTAARPRSSASRRSRTIATRFGPFAPGFRRRAVRRSCRDGGRDHAAHRRRLVEPIQGEAGIIVPPAGWLAGVRRLCDAHGVLLILDEVQIRPRAHRRVVCL